MLELLTHLTRNRARVVPKRAILEAVWAGRSRDARLAGTSREPRTRAIGDRGAHPRVIVTVPGRGYRFEEPLRGRPRAPASGASRLEGCVTRRGRDACLAFPMSSGASRSPAIERLLSDAPRGLATLLLEGEAGIGKTPSSGRRSRRAEAHGFHVSHAAGASEATLSLAAVADLFAPRPPRSSRLAERSARLRSTPRPADRSGRAAGRSAGGRGGCALLRHELAAERPGASRHRLRAVAGPRSGRRTRVRAETPRGPERVAVLATRRPAGTGPASTSRLSYLAIR